MSFFVQSTPAPKPKTKNVRMVSFALATVFVIMVVAQLFGFEEFPDVIAGMWLPGGGGASTIRAAFIVTLEVAAIPFLLSMRLSPLMRTVSMIAGWMVIASWFVATVWQNVSGEIVANSGLLGSAVSLPVGWWSVMLCMTLAILAVWSSWGMWPLTKTKRA